VRSLVLALALLTLSASPAWAQDPFAVTAPDGKVYGATAAELDHWLDVAKRSGARPRDAFQVLVSFAWLRAEADERGVVATHEEAVEEFRAQRDQAFESRRAYRRFLRGSGQTVDDLLVRVRMDLLSTRIREHVTAPAEASVTDAAVDAYLADHGIPRIRERRDIRVVLTEHRRTALAARRELEAGASWGAVARRYSIDEPSRAENGRIPDVERGSVERALQRAIFRARPGRIVGPVRTQFGYYVARVTRIHPARDVPVDEAREQARTILVGEAKEDALSTFVGEFDAKWTARTVCVQRWRSLPWCGN
jgi:foldase protein PrsA